MEPKGSMLWGLGRKLREADAKMRQDSKCPHCGLPRKYFSFKAPAEIVDGKFVKTNDYKPATDVCRCEREN